MYQSLKRSCDPEHTPIWGRGFYQVYGPVLANFNPFTKSEVPSKTRSKDMKNESNVKITVIWSGYGRSR